MIRLQPDVILSGYTQEALEDLAQSTGIPCVSIRAKSINFIDDSFYTAMRVAAEVLGVQERCEEVLQYIDGCKADLDARTADIPDEGKPAVYAGRRDLLRRSRLYRDLLQLRPPYGHPR